VDTATTRPLLVTADETLRDAFVRLSAAAGVTGDLVTSATTALERWTAASVVLVGADVAPALAATAPPRRPGVQVVTTTRAPDALYRAALDCGAEAVLELPAAGTELVVTLADATESGGAVPVPVIGVVGGAGGVGATTLATSLALTLARRRSTLLVDLDPCGGGVERVLGVDDLPGARWADVVPTTGRLGPRSLLETLPRHGRLSVLAWSADGPDELAPTVLRETLAAGRRGFGAVVLDLPRHPDRVAEDALLRCDVVLLVVTTTLPAMAASVAVAGRLPSGRAAVVVRGRPSLDPNEVERALGLPVIATMPDQRRLDESIGLGLGPVRGRRGPLARTCATLADQVITGRVPA
jgi:secretion/DNA translocation related CpaE-like protein